MMGPLLFSSRFALAAGVLLTVLGVAPAGAGSYTAYWDRASFGGYEAGYGVSQATKDAADLAGIEVVELSPLKPNSLIVNHDLIEASFDPGNPATIDSQWSVTNNTGLIQQNAYLVFERPDPNQFVLEERDTGLLLSSGEPGLDWVILQTPSNPLDPSSIPMYYPAVSLGTLGIGETKNFMLHYSLYDLQVSKGTDIDEVELPQWSLTFHSTAVPSPEPSSGLLMFIGLLGIARARRKHS